MPNPVTWTEVADTAVKIGLSGVIAATGAYLLTRRSQRHDLDREYLRRKQDVVLDVSSRLAPIHRIFLEISADYYSLVDYVSSGLPLSQETQDKYTKFFEQIGDSMHKMHMLEAELLLIGADEPTRCLRSYRQQATEINNMLRLENPIKNKQEVEAAGRELSQRREYFYQALAKAFRGI